MKHTIQNIVLLSICMAFLSACGTPESEEVVNCGEGDTLVFQNNTYCIYKGAITETGFNCPAEVPNRYNFEGGTACGKLPNVEESIVEKVGKEAHAKWGTVSESRKNVGSNPTFIECSEVNKTQEYCAAERLEWAYDASTKTLSFKNTRAMLNCCGERKLQAFKNKDGSYELLETDDKEVQGRCSCMCVFDFGIDIENTEPGTIDVSFMRQILDSERDMSKKTLWSGKIEIPSTTTNDTIIVNMDNSEIACELE